MDTLFGLPAHPLLVHIPVVLVPLCAIAVVAMALHRGTFVRLRWIVLGLTGVALVATLLAADAGESLVDSVKQSTTLDGHVEAGDQFRIIMIGFFLAVFAMVLWDWFQHRGAVHDGLAPGTAAASSGATSSGGRSFSSLATVSVALRAVALVAAVVATIFVVDVGHSGATSSWGNVKITSESQDGGG